MATTTTTPNIAAPTTPGAGTTPATTTPTTGTGTGTGTETGKGTENKGPVQFEIDGRKFDINLDDEPTESGDDAEFKFEQLDKFKETDAEWHKQMKMRL